MDKESLLNFMNYLDFMIHDIALIDGKEFVAKKWPGDDEVTWWPMEKEGSGFEQMFKGKIRAAIQNKG